MRICPHSNHSKDACYCPDSKEINKPSCSECGSTHLVDDDEIVCCWDEDWPPLLIKDRR